jgi:hypothetical protein
MIIWNHREYTKRAWHLLQYWRRQRSEPLEFTLHMTNTLLLPVHTWGTVNLDHELGAKRPFRPEWLMTETIGRQVGSLPLSLYAVAGSENEIVKSLPAEQRERIEWGLRAVHEIQRSGPQEERLTDFGYGKEEVTVHNYWDDRPVLTVEPATVKWLVLAKPESGEAMVVLTNWSESAVTARVKVDPAQLHLDAAQVTDHESGASLAESVTSTIKVDLPGPWGNRILSLGP